MQVIEMKRGEPAIIEKLRISTAGNRTAMTTPNDTTANRQGVA